MWKNLLTLLLLCPCLVWGSDLTEDLIKDRIIKESVKQYSGQCVCPYYLKDNGSYCVEESIYFQMDRKGPICYRDDITKNMLEKYKKENKAK